MEAAARVVIGDWNGGKMKHYATPPGFDPSVMIDVDALRKELMDDADDETGDMIIEQNSDNEGMNTE